jgi:hypothetical protein
MSLASEGRQTMPTTHFSPQFMLDMATKTIKKLHIERHCGMEKMHGSIIYFLVIPFFGFISIKK